MHDHRIQIICGTEVCGVCYEQDLLAEVIRDQKPMPELEWVYEPSVHRKILKVKDARRSTTAN